MDNKQQPLPAELQMQPKQPPTLARPPKQNHHVLKLLSVIVLFIIVLVLGSMFLSSESGKSPLSKLLPFSQNPTPTETTTTQNETLTPAPSEQQTDNTPSTDQHMPTTWQTYKNTSANFSIPYPADLKQKETSYPFGVTSVELRSPDTGAEFAPDFQLLVFPKSLGKNIGQDFDAYYAMENNTTTTIKNPTGKEDAQDFTKTRNRTVNGLKAIDYTATSSPPQGGEEKEIGVYIELGNNVLVVSTGESNKAVLESMLTQFKYPL